MLRASSVTSGRKVRRTMLNARILRRPAAPVKTDGDLRPVVKVPASHRGRRGAPMARRDDREYREYLREEQRSQPGVPNAAAALGWSGDASPVERGPQRGSRAGGPECSRTFTTGCWQSIHRLTYREAIMSIRAVRKLITAKPTLEGAGVHLRRAFGFGQTSDYDPFLLLDD